MLVVYLHSLKFAVLFFDESIKDWRTVCLFNYDFNEELKQSGKRFAKIGHLKS